jgi:hypothetical protein
LPSHIELLALSTTFLIFASFMFRWLIPMVDPDG